MTASVKQPHRGTAPSFSSQISSGVVMSATVGSGGKEIFRMCVRLCSVSAACAGSQSSLTFVHSCRLNVLVGGLHQHTRMDKHPIKKKKIPLPSQEKLDYFIFSSICGTNNYCVCRCLNIISVRLCRIVYNKSFHKLQKRLFVIKLCY